MAVLDRINIIAHDRFQEIIKEAKRGDAPIRLKPSPCSRPRAKSIGSRSAPGPRPAPASAGISMGKVPCGLMPGYAGFR